MRKQLYRDNFTIIPESGVLVPNEVKEISIRFQSKEEMRLKTRNNSDIVMEILEGASLEKFQEVTINVNVNSQFSKYTIQPPRCINFGPMLFSDVKQKEFTINNLGHFPFKFHIFDFYDEETRKQIQEEEDEALAAQHA